MIFLDCENTNNNTRFTLLSWLGQLYNTTPAQREIIEYYGIITSAGKTPTQNLPHIYFKKENLIVCTTGLWLPILSFRIELIKNTK